jgi:hypothetical protein
VLFTIASYDGWYADAGLYADVAVVPLSKMPARKRFVDVWPPYTRCNATEIAPALREVSALGHVHPQSCAYLSPMIVTLDGSPPNAPIFS